jgi:hypothetical protein
MILPMDEGGVKFSWILQCVLPGRNSSLKKSNEAPRGLGYVKSGSMLDAETVAMFHRLQLTGRHRVAVS